MSVARRPAVPTAGSQPQTGQRWRVQAGSGLVVAGYLAEPVRMLLPVRARPFDLLMTGTDEVPPHHDLFGERHTAEQHRPARPLRADGQTGRPASTMPSSPSANSVPHRCAGPRSTNNACSCARGTGSVTGTPASMCSSGPSSSVNVCTGDSCPASRPTNTRARRPGANSTSGARRAAPAAAGAPAHRPRPGRGTGRTRSEPRCWSPR